MKTVDVLVIGAGQGAPVVFEAAQSAGKSVVIAESGEVGGSCVNFGCTPTKAALASTNLLALSRRAEQFGLRIESAEPDYPEILRQAAAFAAKSRQGLEDYFGDRLVRGRAKLVGQTDVFYRVEIGEEEFLTHHVVIGTGTRSVIPKIEGIEDVGCITAENWLHRTQLPKSIAIIGGGYIAIEMSQFYQRLGCSVTVIDKSPRILANEDEDVTGLIRSVLECEGVRFLLETSFDRVEKSLGGWRLSCSCPEGPTQLEAEAIFIAAGRRANTDDLGLEGLGIEPDEKTGYLQVDEHLRTSSHRVFAMGDVRGGGLFTSTAWDDGRIVSDYLFGEKRRTTDRLVPYAVFCDPEVGRVGLSEHAAKAAGRKFRVSKFNLAKNGHAEEHRATTGFVKLLIDEGTDLILGATVVAVGASDLVMLFSLMMQTKSPVSVLRDMVVIHPTFSEALQSAVL